MGVRRYYIELVEGKKKGLFAFLAKIFLFLLSLIYWFLIQLRNFLYSRNLILNQISFNIPIISIGNLTWGGTGKTSLSIVLSKRLSGKKIALLARGYGSDEVELLKKSLKESNTHLFVGKNRAQILDKISSDYDLAIFDDGFQYRKVKRDLDILLINGKNPFGGNRVLPLGILREPKSCLRRADIVIIMNSAPKSLQDYLKTINPSLEVFSGYYEVKGLFDFEGEVFPKETLLNKPLACFCAIGYPQGFIESLKSIGLRPILNFIYPDHYNLKEKDFRTIESECKYKGIKHIIITAKDEFRFKFSTELSIFILEVSLKIDRLDYFLNIVEDKIASKTKA